MPAHLLASGFRSSEPAGSVLDNMACQLSPQTAATAQGDPRRSSAVVPPYELRRSCGLTPGCTRTCPIILHSRSCRICGESDPRVRFTIRHSSEISYWGAQLSGARSDSSRHLLTCPSAVPTADPFHVDSATRAGSSQREARPL